VVDAVRDAADVRTHPAWEADEDDQRDEHIQERRDRRGQPAVVIRAVEARAWLGFRVRVRLGPRVGVGAGVLVRVRVRVRVRVG
jgi:hypothetical protein